jgi:hypothetical protein
MLKRLVLATSFAAALGVGIAALGEARVEAYYAVCKVRWNVSKTYLYGQPPTYLGERNDWDVWAHDMTLHDCTSNLAQVRVKQWGNEVCDQYGGEYVTLYWKWEFDDFNSPIDEGILFQQYDCNDVP